MTLLALFGYQDMQAINALRGGGEPAGQRRGGCDLHCGQAGGVGRLPAGDGDVRRGRVCFASLSKRAPSRCLRGPAVAIGLAMAGWFFWRE